MLEQAVVVVMLVFWSFVLEKIFMDSLLNWDFSKLKLLGIVTDFRWFSSGTGCSLRGSQSGEGFTALHSLLYLSMHLQKQ